MKKLALLTICLAFCAGFAYAAMPTDEDYENLDALRAKIVRMKREMDKFMRDIISTYPQEGGYDAFGQDIRVDMTQTDADVIVRADLPGMSKDKIDITLEKNRILRIAGMRDVERKVTAPGVIRQERMQGRFERVLELPVECKGDGIKATYKDGVLEVVIPKAETAKEKPVKISVD